MRRRSRAYREPAACICTSAGCVEIFNPEPDLHPVVHLLVQGPRPALELLLPGLIHVKAPVVRGIVQVAVISQRRPKRLSARAAHHR